MPNLMRTFDGSGRTPRANQLASLQWAQDNWDTVRVLATNEPVGAGKSFIAKTVQNATGGAIITPANILIEQYMSTYRNSNYLKGKTHYKCISGLTCLDWTDVLNQPACENCPYDKCRDLAKNGAPTIFNPMSLFYTTLHQPINFPSIVVDEAHQLPNMLLMLCDRKLRHSLYKFDDRCISEIYLIPWLKEQIGKLRRLMSAYQKAGDFDKALEIADEASTLDLVYRSMRDESNNFAIWISDGIHHGKPEKYLNVKAVRPPRFLVNSLLKSNHILLMSGTLFEHDIKDLIGTDKYAFRDAPSPIPKEQRPVLYRPAKFKMNYQTDPGQIAGWIKEQLNAYPGLNTMVHVTYSLSKKLEPYFPGALFNTPANKEQMVDRFKVSGGLFIAAGCAEGLDLKGDWCRLNLVPKLSFPDRSDKSIEKRIALENGDEWYDLETLKILIQQIGRSTRSPTDWSIAIIGDPNFSRIYSRRKGKLPRYFGESILWSGAQNVTNALIGRASAS